MPKTKQLIGDAGVIFNNAVCISHCFIDMPCICMKHVHLVMCHA